MCCVNKTKLREKNQTKKRNEDLTRMEQKPLSKGGELKKGECGKYI